MGQDSSRGGFCEKKSVAREELRMLARAQLAQIHVFGGQELEWVVQSGCGITRTVDRR